MNYLAKEDGFVGGVRIRAGQTFAYEGKPGKWMEPVKDQKKDDKDDEPTKGKPKKADEPTTFSEIAKRDGKAQGHKNGNAA